jgi:hypothetical protein
MAVSRRLRFEVLRRDNYTCRYCGASAPDAKLTVDHVNPSALGGEDHPENLVTACAACNGGKSSISPDAKIVADVAADAFRWSSAIRVAADQMLTDLDQRNGIRNAFDEAWSKWNYGPDSDRKPIPRPDGWERSVDSFIAAGLPMPILVDCIGKAMANKKLSVDAIFRYMCGIAWKKVAELQATARGHLAAETQTDDGHAEGYELMYRELIASIFGVLPFGPDSPEDVRALASLQQKSLEEYDEPVILDTEGLAAAELISRHCDLIYEARTIEQKLLSDLPAEVLEDLHGQAHGLHDWPEELFPIGDRRLFREFITARMASLHLFPELRVEAWDEQEASK